MSDWTFMTVNHRLGEKRMISPNYDETYIITRAGTWVPTDDVEYLNSIKLPCPMIGARVKAFSIGNPSKNQMATMPQRSPQQKKRKRTYRAKVEKVEVSTEEVDTKEKD